MVRSITKKYSEWSSNNNNNSSKIDLVIMRGSGDKAFCAGGDIKAVYDAKKNPSSKSGGEAEEPITSAFFREEYDLNNMIATLPFPQIAIIDGITMGGGVGLSVHGTFRVATEKTVFAMPETQIGFFCDVGGSFFLPKLRGLSNSSNLGMFLALTGNQLRGKAVYQSGVATHFVKSSEIPKLVSALVSGSVPTSNKEQISQAIQSFSHGKHGDESQEHDPSVADKSLQEYERIAEQYFGEPSVQAIIKKLSDHASTDAGAKKTLEKMSQMSPTSLVVVHKQILQGKTKKTLREALDMEYRISQELVKQEDFFEGVRALLVDKDKNPKWNPKDLKDVKLFDF